MRRVTLLTKPPAHPVPAMRTYAGRVVDQLVRGAEMDTPESGYYLVKRGLDCAFALAVAVVAGPVALAAMLVVRLTSRGPAIYTQKRVGYAGRPFTIYKIRTMIHNCESLTGPRWCVPGDPRVTGVGGVLRRLHIDELPQLWNVLRGDMSLVGPRPLLMEYVPRYMPEQWRRHEVRPGITGWAQVNGRNALSWDEKFALDVWYVDHRSFRLDLDILARTAREVLSGHGVSSEGHATMPPFQGSRAHPPVGR